MNAISGIDLPRTFDFLGAFRKGFLKITRSSAFVIIVCLVVLNGCKKDHGDGSLAPIPPPLSMQVIGGNNQVGYPNREPSDTIVIKVIPKNASDIDGYSYIFKNSTSGGFNAITAVINGEYYIKVAWSLGASTTPQQFTLSLLGNCINPYIDNCKELASVVLNATVNNKPWVQIFADNSGVIGPGAFWDMHFSDALHGVAVGDFKTGLAVTDDGGATWNFMSSIRNDYFKLSFSNKDTGLAIVTNNYAYFTVDGGRTFTAGSWSPPTVGDRSSTDFFMVNRNVIYSTGYQGTITKTLNGGQSWTKYNGFTFINGLSSITCTDPNTCYACGDVAKIVKTTDGGNTWTEQPILINNHLRKIYFIDANFGFAGGQYGALVRTTDGGTHWSIIPTGLRSTITEIRFFSNSSGFIVSSSGEIAKTTDGGLTWKKIVADSYGVSDLNKAFIKDSVTVLGLQWQRIFKYDLRQ